MNTLVIVLIAAVCLVAAYALYGRWIARSWGIDPNAKTPAVLKNDGKDYVPTDGWTVFSHQFSSIAGAAPSPAPSRPPRSAGCPFSCGSSWAASSSAPSQTSARCTPASRTKANPWAC